MVINVTVVGPFEEEEEGTDIFSDDVLYVKGEDPTTSVPLTSGMTPGPLDSPISGQQKKATHTHTQEKNIFERLYLVPVLGTFGPKVNCPYAPTTPTVNHPTIS